MNGIEDRFGEMESRLERLEQLVQSIAAGAKSTETSKMTTVSGVAQGANAAIAKPTNANEFSLHDLMKAPPAKRRGNAVPAPGNSISVTNILGWTGATAMVLAAAYLILLAVDSGWLTPGRQIALAVVSGIALIGAGLGLRNSDRNYAGLLPAGGLVILFLSIYGAHVYYHLIGTNGAVGAVVVTCIGALWLGRLFESELYALFAVVGSYSAPFLLPSLTGAITDLVIYFSAWSVLFCIYSVWVGTRRPYLLAAYMALLGFNAVRVGMPSPDWGMALIFQSVQFVIFLGGAVVFSVRRNSPMDKNVAIVHMPLLLIFYALQYSLLQSHMPAIAPWAAIWSAALLLVAYWLAKAFLNVSLEAGSILVGAYVTVTLFHAGYLELLPSVWAPWVALSLPLAYLIISKGKTAMWPVELGIGAIFIINYMRVIADTDLDVVPGHDFLGMIYAIQLYGGYYFSRRLPMLSAFGGLPLFAGHIALMAAAVNVVDDRLVVSLAWGVLGIACLALSLRIKDKLLGKSSLLVFAASVTKVLLYDLSGAAPLVRIACLGVLGLTLYAGGWMYRKVDSMAPHPPA